MIALNGKILDPEQEHELLRETPGFSVEITYKDGEAPYNVVFHNVTEVHWRYPSPVQEPQVAIESNVHGTGFTQYIDRIKELLIYDATKVNPNF